MTEIDGGADEFGFGLAVHPMDNHYVSSHGWSRTSFAVHNEETLRRLAALQNSAIVYFVDLRLLEVTNSALHGSVTFYPTYSDPTECRYPGTPSTIGALTQVVVDGALGSVSGVWEL